MTDDAANNPKHRFRVLDLDVDLERETVIRAKQAIDLPELSFRLFAALIRHAPHTVSKDELITEVWDGVVVSDETLAQRVLLLRQAFGEDSQNPHYFSSVRGRGYRMICDVRPVGEAAHRSKATYGLIGVALLVIAALLFFNNLQDDSPPAPAENSIAVLPFVNMSDDASNEYFSDGLSEELLNLLAKIPELKVIGRTSSFAFKGKNEDLRGIGQALGVNTLLEGSVRKSGERIRITSQLIDVSDGAHMWAETYDRQLTASNIFTIQSEIAKAIADTLRTTLTPAEQERIESVPTQNMAALESYFLGRQLFYQRGPALDGAIAALQLAVDRDPAFADAWAFLAAAAQITWGYNTSINNENALALAEQASRRALDLDPRLAIALSVRALLAHDRRQLNEAFDFFQRAINADSNDSTIRMWFGQINFHYGYLSEALVHLEQAYELDPLVGINNGSLGITYLVAGQEALAQARFAKAEELGWDHHVAAKFSHLIHSGAVESAVAYLEPFLTDTDDPVEFLQKGEVVETLLARNPVLVNALWPHGTATRTMRSGWWRLSLLSVFDLRDRFFEEFSKTVARSTRWRYSMRSIWLPGNRAYVEDPRFLEIMGEAGTVALWEERGYPDSCVRVSGPAGDHLDCTERYR
jgi:TolB-like protein/DNA-binding winged helix-turn-helix (wHTH) protein